MDSSHEYLVDDADRGPATPTQAELEAMFSADDAEVAAGQVVPAEPVLAELRATADRLRRERASKEATAPRRA